MSVDLPEPFAPQDSDDPAPLKAEGDVDDRKDGTLRSTHLEPLGHPLDEEGRNGGFDPFGLARDGQAFRRKVLRLSDERGGHGGWSFAWSLPGGKPPGWPSRISAMCRVPSTK